MLRSRRFCLPLLLVLLLLAPASAATLEELVGRYEREKGEPFQVRYPVLQEIANLGTEPAVRFLAKVIAEDPDASIRSNAVHQLARVPLGSAFAVLVGLWESGDDNLKSNVLSAMANYRSEPVPRAIVEEVLGSANQSLRSTLIRWFGKTGDARFLPEAERFLADFPTGATSLTSTLVGVKTPAAARLLVRIYDDTRKYDRDQVPKVFAEGDESVRQVLVDVLRGPDGPLVENAIALAARAKVALAEPALVALLRKAKGERRIVLIEAVGAVGARTPEGREAILAALGDRETKIAIAAARALRSAPGRDAIPLLIDAMEGAEASLRVELRVTLERVTGQQYGDRLDLWRKWWEEFGDEFDPDDVRAPDPDAVDTALVNLAIDKGAAALKAMRGKEPPWEYASHPVGTTALVCLALHAAGVDVKDRDLRAGVEYLLEATLPDHTYSLGLVAMALESIGGRRYGRRVVECGRRLISSQLDAGHWGYPTGDGDNSNTQYAVLGLRSAARVGMKVPERTWRGVRDHFLATRCPDGGWSYQPSHRTTSSSSMTAAGISSLLICLENMKLGEEESEELLAAIEKGFEALGERMNLENDSLYALYGIERAGILGRRPAMGGRPWYGPGARRLVEEQDREGLWRGNYHEAVDTSFAILFLKKFTAPISTR